MEDEKRLAAAREARRGEIKDYLRDYLGPERAEHLGSLRWFEAGELPGEHRREFEFLNDRRLDSTLVAVVPKKAWHKSTQPSESHVSRDLILFEEGYFDGADESAWMTHELTHVAKFKDGAEEYRLATDTPAVEGLDAIYPNNEVERAAFKKQFEYLRSNKIGRERIRELMSEQYAPEDLAILDRWLAEVFG